MTNTLDYQIANTQINAYDWDAIVAMMDDDLREWLHNLKDWAGDNLGFLAQYQALHKAKYGEYLTIA